MTDNVIDLATARRIRAEREQLVPTRRAFGLTVPAMGPSRKVLRESPLPGPGRKLYVYALECGHTVVRSSPRRERCVCEVCGPEAKT